MENDFTGNSNTLPEPGSAAYFGVTDDSSAFPSSNPTPSNPLVYVPDPSPSTPGGFLDTLETYASTALTDVESAASSVFHGGVQAGGAVLDTVESAVKTGYSAGKGVVSDVVGGVEGIASFGVNQVILVVAVVGVALYFIGKTGAVKVSF